MLKVLQGAVSAKNILFIDFILPVKKLCDQFFKKKAFWCEEYFKNLKSKKEPFPTMNKLLRNEN